jgi:hypothetical protein
VKQRELREKEFRELLPEEQRDIYLGTFSDTELNGLISAAIRLEMRRELPRKRTRRR